MPQYFAVAKHIGICTKSLDAKPSSFFKPCNVSGLKKVSINNINDHYNESKELHLFATEKDAIAFAKESSNYIDTQGTFYAKPIMMVTSDEEIALDSDQKNGTTVDKANTTLVSGKMLYVGNQFVENLPYTSINEINLNHASTAPQSISSSKDFDLRKATLIALTFAFLMHNLNHNGTRSDIGFNIIAAAIGVFLYFRYAQNSAYAQSQIDIQAEIKSQITLGKKM